MVNDAADDAIGLQLPQLLNEHLLRYAWYGTLKVREPQNLAPEEMEENDQLPSSLEQLEGLFHPCGG